MTSHIAHIELAATAALATYANTVGGIVPPGSFLQASAVQAGIEANSIPLPLVLLFDLTTNLASTTAKVSRANCTIYFADAKPGQGDDAQLEAEAVARMEALQKRFFAVLDLSPIAEITNLRATPFHNHYAALLTGVGVQFVLGLPAGLLDCEPPIAPAAVLVTEPGNYLVAE